MRAQMLDELRDVVDEMHQNPTAPGPKERFDLLVRQMTQRERYELRDVLREMLMAHQPTQRERRKLINTLGEVITKEQS